MKQRAGPQSFGIRADSRALPEMPGPLRWEPVCRACMFPEQKETNQPGWGSHRSLQVPHSPEVGDVSIGPGSRSRLTLLDTEGVSKHLSKGPSGSEAPGEGKETAVTTFSVPQGCRSPTDGEKRVERETRTVG